MVVPLLPGVMGELGEPGAVAPGAVDPGGGEVGVAEPGACAKTKGAEATAKARVINVFLIIFRILS